MEAARLRGERAADQLQTAYRRLIDTARASQRQAQQVAAALKRQTDDRGKRLTDQLNTIYDKLLRLRYMIGGVLVAGASAPRLVSRAMIAASLAAKSTWPSLNR